jgi:hypothetical protein
MQLQYPQPTLTVCNCSHHADMQGDPPPLQGALQQAQEHYLPTQPDEVVGFRDGSPLAATHVLRRNHPPKLVCVLNCPRQPGPDASDDERNNWCAFVLGVFKSYRGRPIPEGMTPQQAYTSWMDELDATETGHR